MNQRPFACMPLETMEAACHFLAVGSWPSVSLPDGRVLGPIRAIFELEREKRVRLLMAGIYNGAYYAKK